MLLAYSHYKYIMASKEYLQYQYLAINPATSGDTTLVQRVPGKRIALVGILAVADGEVAVTFKTDSGPISGEMSLIANSGFSIFNPGGVCVSRSGGPIIINLSASIKVGLTITYELKD